MKFVQLSGLIILVLYSLPNPQEALHPDQGPHSKTSHTKKQYCNTVTESIGRRVTGDFFTLITVLQYYICKQNKQKEKIKYEFLGETYGVVA